MIGGALITQSAPPNGGLLMVVYLRSKKLESGLVELGHVSHSQIEMFLRCPRQWEHRYIEGRIIPPGGALVFGGSYHTALEYNFQHKIQTSDDMPVDDCVDCFVDAWNHAVGQWEERSLPVVWGDDNPNALMKTGIALVQKYRTEIAPSVIPARVEHRYSLKVAGTLFVGATDVELEGEVDVIDHKTASKSSNQADLDNALQPSAHAFALGRELVYEHHIAVKTSKPHIQILRTKRTHGDIVWWLDLATLVIAQMRTGLYPPNPNGWHCSPKWCGYWDLCKGGINAD